MSIVSHRRPAEPRPGVGRQSWSVASLLALLLLAACCGGDVAGVDAEFASSINPIAGSPRTVSATTADSEWVEAPGTQLVTPGRACSGQPCRGAKAVRRSATRPELDATPDRRGRGLRPLVAGELPAITITASRT